MARPTPEKLALLRKMLQEKGIQKRAGGGVIPRRPNPNADAPLSNGQTRLWFLDQFEPGSSLYNDALALTIRLEPDVDFDPERFRDAFAEVVRRHDVLRTTFHTGSAGPVQRVAAPADARVGRELPFDIVDLASEDADERLRVLLLALVREPFELDKLPLLRGLLARVDEDRWVFGLAMHHIISDGVSYGVIYAELGALYRAFAAERPSPLEEPSIQFGDFAQWEHDQLDEGAIENKLRFWKRTLGGDLPAIRWPAKDATPRHGGAYHRFRFSAALYNDLSRFCRERQVTSNWVLMAAYFALLHSLDGQTDLRIGTPSSTRKHGELERQIGFFVQTVILRVDLSGNPTFLDVLERTRATALEASEHEDAPFERIVQAVRPGRDTSAVPLIQAWIAPMKDLMDPPDLPGAACEYEIIDGKIARFDFALILDEARGGVEAFAEYDTDLFDARTAGELVERYLAILRQAVTHPDSTLTTLRTTAGKLGTASAAPQPARRAGPKSMKRARRRSATDPNA